MPKNPESLEIEISGIYKRDKPISLIISSAILIPCSLLSFAASFFIMPMGIAVIICSFALLLCAVTPFMPKTRVNCPFCGKRHLVTRQIGAFRCGHCGKRIKTIYPNTKKA